MRRKTATIRLPLLLITPLLSSCSTLEFYSQGIAGQVEILRKSRSCEMMIADLTTPVALRQRLQLAKELRQFASRELALPGHSAYGKYADLGRNHVIFVLFAAPEFSMEPITWRYPLIGEMDYRGYFKEKDAAACAKELIADGYETYLGGTDAYSTLGFFHDPVLNTFAGYREIDFAELIFHELTHTRIFRKGETTFNESLANAVAEEGVRKWLISKGRRTELADYEEHLIRRREFYCEIDTTRRELTDIYTSEIPAEEMRKSKQIALDRLKSRARALQARWDGKFLAGWLRLNLNNAHLLPFVTYNSEIVTFRKLLEESDDDFEIFFRKVEEIELPLRPKF